MRVTIWGCRGSIPTPGAATSRYGGNTTCIECRSGDTRVILDAGTGIRELGQAMMAEGVDPSSVTYILLTHTHWDHIQGFPFFTPAFVDHANFVIYGCEGYQQSVAQIMAGQMSVQYFPVSLEHMLATIRFVGLPQLSIDLGPLHITYHHMNHPGMCLGYRVESGGKTFIFTGDHEPFKEPFLMSRSDLTGEDEAYLDRRFMDLVDFCKGADLLITDAQYTDDEYPQKITWGHSPTSYSAKLAHAAGVKRLLLSHHDPDHDDDQVDKIVKTARAELKKLGSKIECDGAREGMTIEL